MRLTEVVMNNVKMKDNSICWGSSTLPNPLYELSDWIFENLTIHILILELGN